MTDTTTDDTTTEPAPEPASEPATEDEERYAHMAAQADVPETDPEQRQAKAVASLAAFVDATSGMHPSELRSLLCENLSRSQMRALRQAVDLHGSAFNWSPHG